MHDRACSRETKILDLGNETTTPIIVPWQMVCEQTGGILKVIPINDAGELRMDAYRDLLGERTRLVAVAHISERTGDD